MNTATLRDQCKAEGVLFVAVELSGSSWRVGSTVDPGQKAREKTVRAGDVVALGAEIGRAKKRFGLGESALVVSVYEAGRDGFWVHRWLESIKVVNLVVDPASIDVNRRKRRAKTDHLDVGMLLSNLMRWFSGERKVWAVVRVPSVEEEDARQLHRERDTLIKERTSHINRIKALLALHGLHVERIESGRPEQLDELRVWDGSVLPGMLKERLRREYGRLALVESQLELVARERRQQLQRSADPRVGKVRKLVTLRGIGEQGSWVLGMEIFGWRQFDNRKQVGSLVGLTGTPSNSGSITKEQGIDKAGNARVRALLIEMAWSWVRWQPHSEITLWFNRRFAGGSKRQRRVGIVAVARKLLIALWRFVEQGTVPAGAIVFPK